MTFIRPLIGLAAALTLFSYSPTAKAAAGPGPIVGTPIPLCVWKLLSTATTNVHFNAFGYNGRERLIRIHSGNYDTTNNNIDYTVEVIWDPADCSGEQFTVRFPMHGLTDHVEIEVHDGGGLIGSITADLGTLPVPRDSAGTALTTTDLGPFVISDTMATQMGRTVAFFLLDQQILSRLPEPAYYNGAAPTNWLQELLMGLAYEFAVGQNQDLFEYFVWRRYLDDMSGSAQSRAATAIDNHITDPGVFAATVWEDHTGVIINHGIGWIAPTATTFGGFWNGHRHYLQEMEAHLASLTDSERVPFRRLPAYHPNDTIPSAFNINIANTTPAQPLGAAYQSANVCANYPSTLSAALTLEDRLIEVQETIYGDVNPWHGTVHGAIGGDMASVTTAARAPIFFAWHGTVDVIWQNWQLCEGAWDDATYSWL